MSAANHGPRGGGTPNRCGSSLPSTPLVGAVSEGGAASPAELHNPATLHSVTQSRGSSPARFSFKNDPYKIPVAMGSACPASPSSNYPYSRSASVAGYDYRTTDFGRGHGWTHSEARFHDGGCDNFNGSMSRASMSQASFRLTYKDGQSSKFTDIVVGREPLEHEILSSRAESFVGSPQTGRGQTEIYPMGNNNHCIRRSSTPQQHRSAAAPRPHYWALPATCIGPPSEPFTHTSRYDREPLRHAIGPPQTAHQGPLGTPRDCFSSYQRSRPCSPGGGGSDCAMSPKHSPSRPPHADGVAVRGDTSVDKNLRSPMSSEYSVSGDNHAPSPDSVAATPGNATVRVSKPKPDQSPPTTPYFDPSKPITAWLVVKSKRRGFRCPITLENYIEKLPIGKRVIVWRDCGQFMGTVTSHISNVEVIRDYQRAQNSEEEEDPPSAEEFGLRGFFRNAERSSYHSRVSSSASDDGQPPLTAEQTKVYSGHTVSDDTPDMAGGQVTLTQKDIQARIWEIVGADEYPTRIIRVATREDRRVRTTRRKEQEDMLPVVADIVEKACQSHQRQHNNTTQDYREKATDSTDVVAKDVECQQDWKKITVYLYRQDPAAFADFNRISSRAHKKYKSRIDVVYMDEIAADEGDPKHVRHLRRQRKEREATNQALRESKRAASSPPSNDAHE